ncbi:MarR family winged helix-turn-helix transcriptional regulator [Ammoniphilus sp. 3BR4]|uniref:MarR family winged helix-turn-helix transcriptional regulator n=1 Tax=Ammoniphilus sp. 3BR4 TaxID=3158265 RepID=UPI003466E2B5
MMNNLFGHRVNILGRLVSKKLNKMISYTGLTGSQWPVIVRLLLSEELTQSEICEQLSIEASTASQTLYRMEQMGWVTRIDGTDKREKKVILTKKAKDHLSLWFQDTNSLEKKLMDEIPLEDIAVFDRVLDKMIDNMRKEK